MPSKSLLLVSRKVHLYFGLFISPALLFFAFTGAFQTLGLHEPSADYKPAGILAELGQLHKKQTTVMPVRRSQAPEAGRTDNPGPRRGGDAPQPAPGSRLRDRDIQSGNGTAPGQPDRVGAPGLTSSPQQPALPEHKQDVGTRNSGSNAPQQAPTLQAKQKQHLPMKIFFVLVSLGLFTSTVTGIYMAFKYDRNTILVTALLLAGIAIPLLLLRL